MTRFAYAKTLILGFGFFGLSVLWAIYNAYVPILLQAGRPDFAEAAGVRGFGLDPSTTGFIMTLDNIAALLILPYIGALSDRTHARIGRRKPYILIGAPIAALAFTAIPWLSGQSLPAFMGAIVITLLAMDLFRTPVISLMPDITPSKFRSQANGVINLMGGLGSVAAFLVGGALFRAGVPAPFAFGAALMLAAVAVVLVAVREPAAGEVDDSGDDRPPGLFAAIRDVFASPERSALLLLGALFFSFLSYAAIEVFWTSFATNELGMNPGAATQALTFFGLAIVLCAVPAGLIGGKIGRKRAMLIGMAGFALMLAWGYVLSSGAVAPFMLVAAGAFWSLIVVNALPMVVDLASDARAGTSTGLYYLATQFAAIVGPILIGAIIQAAGNNYRIGFVFAPLSVLLALGLLLTVRRGEARGAGAG